MRKIYTSIIYTILIISSCCFFQNELNAQHSVAREWNELLLESIRNDLARPTVHARNLFHTSVAMYDVFALTDAAATPYFVGQTVDGYHCTYTGFPMPANVQSAREEAISYAMYRILRHRFLSSNASFVVFPLYDNYMSTLGYPINFTSVDYSTGSAAALGNYIAQEIINFGLQDGSNESINYSNTSYSPVNPSLVMEFSGNADLDDFNRWQPLTLEVFIDQSGNVFPINTPPFLSPEWGQVTPFALKDTDKTTYQRNGFDYEVYHDPSDPPYIDTLNGGTLSDEYKWGFSLVSKWSSHLDTANNVLWDISPASIGNITSYPTTIAGLQGFYDSDNGGDTSVGHTTNPATGMPYVPQIVKRGDYTRILAEFWADGPSSETPPGHWYSILNYVSDHPSFVKQFEGMGAVLNDLEWDIKAYFMMGGAVHDAAITAWGIKGWYDYIRPVSAIRGMAELGQSSDPALPNYHIGGFPLETGFAELVQIGDPLAGASNEHVDKVKLFAWRGPDYIADPMTDEAGAGWILAENWWPYQRPSFVTPNFAGYVSGHSTFSRAAAEVMTMLTGDAFFPDGMGQFSALQNDFLVFEEGPSMDITLQWATYRDASDQCSLSRIWGGIHPPVDDIPGRLMGIEIGTDAFSLAKDYFLGNICDGTLVVDKNPVIPMAYDANIAIYSKGTIPFGTTIEFTAGECILLESGFEVELGGKFTTTMQGCQ